jgi:hypothetical protein
MAHKIEPSPSARASCRGCKGQIARGTYRFGEEFANAYSGDGAMSYRYWHLACAAKSMANELLPLLEALDQPDLPEVQGADPPQPSLAELKELARAHLRPEMPHAERAGSGRARCRACEVTIKKDELRVAFERTFDGPMGPQKGASYAHPGCVARYLERERERGHEASDLADVRTRVLANSRLSPGDLDAVREALGG